MGLSALVPVEVPAPTRKHRSFKAAKQRPRRWDGGRTAGTTRHHARRPSTPTKSLQITETGAHVRGLCGCVWACVYAQYGGIWSIRYAMHSSGYEHESGTPRHMSSVGPESHFSMTQHGKARRSEPETVRRGSVVALVQCELCEESQASMSPVVAAARTWPLCS